MSSWVQQCTVSKRLGVAGAKGKMTHATRSTSASIMGPMPGGNRKEQGTVVARKAQGLWKWQSWAGLPLASVILGKFIYF